MSDEGLVATLHSESALTSGLTGKSETSAVADLCSSGIMPQSYSIFCQWHHKTTDEKYLDKLPKNIASDIRGILLDIERSADFAEAKDHVHTLVDKVAELTPQQQKDLSPLLKRYQDERHLNSHCDYGRFHAGLERRKIASTNMGAESAIRSFLYQKCGSERLDQAQVSTDSECTQQPLTSDVLVSVDQGDG